MVGSLVAVARFGRVCQMPAAVRFGGAGIAAGSTITSGQRIHHTRPFTQNPHNPAASPAPGGRGDRVCVGSWVWVWSVRRAVTGPGLRGVAAVAEQPDGDFAELLRQLRAKAGLTQEELAEAAALSPRSVSDLERGIHRTAHKDTALLLAGALGLGEPAHALFVAAARGRGPSADVLAAVRGEATGAAAAAATKTLPGDIAA